MENTILTVDYAMSLEEMVAAGNYSEVDDITAKRFPLSGIGKVVFEAKLFHFGFHLSKREVAERVESEGFNLAKIEHLLAFGAALPEVQRMHPVIALGSVAKIRGVRCGARLGSHDSSERYLGSEWLGGEWSRRFHFLGVREIQPKS